MIAISYRREDSLPVTGRLYDRLQAEFGRGNVFMDFDSIPYGVDFRDHIKQMIDRSKVLIAMIGPDWVGRRRHRGRRIDEPTDFVRLEIGYALERKLPIIPILVGNTQMPRSEELPKDIEALAFRNGLTLDAGIDFHHHAERLVGAINRILTTPPPSPPVVQPAPPQTPVTSPTAETSRVPPETSLERLVEPSEPRPVSKPTLLPPVAPTPPKPPEPATGERTPAAIPVPPASPSEKVSEAVAPTPSPKPVKKPQTPITPKAPERPSWTARFRKSISRLQERVMADYLRPYEFGTLRKRALANWNWKKVSGFILAFVFLAIVVTAIWYWELFPTVSAPPVTNRAAATPTIPSILKSTPSPAAPSEGTLRVDSTPWGLDFEVIDAKGNHRTGVTPAVVSLALGAAQVIYKNGNQEHRETVSVSSGAWSSVGWTVPQESPPAIAQSSPSPAPTATQQAVAPSVAGATAGTPSSPSVTQTAPPSGPASISENWQRGIEDFVKQFVSVNQTQDVEKTLAFYAPKVDYFADRGKDQGYIRRDIQKYNVQWPARRDSIDGDVHVEEKAPNQQYRADFKLNFYAENTSSAEWSKGEMAMTLDLNIIDGVPKIVAINQKRLRRQNGRGKGPRPADMEPIGPIKPTKLTKVLIRKYGFSALVPSEMFPEAEAKLADGTTDRLNSVKGCATMAFSAPHENVRKVYDDYVNQFFHAAPDRRTVDYKVVKDTWFVVSGSSRTTGYYVKGVKHGDDVFVMQLEYVGAVCRIPASMVAEMSHAFDGTVASEGSAPPRSDDSASVPTNKLTRIYVKKYGVSLLIPTDIFPDANKLSTSGEEVLSANDGVTTLKFYESNEPLAKAYAGWTQPSRKLQGRRIEYKVLKQDWFVVSGNFGPNAEDAANLGFYTKAVRKGNKLVFMHLRYKDDGSLITEDILTPMARSFDGH